MNKLLHFLLIIIFFVSSFTLSAQIQVVSKNSTHKYKMGENISTSKYLWRVTKKDGSYAEKGKDYDFVVSYEDRNSPLEPIAIVENNRDILDFSLSKSGQNEVYILWLREGEYNVSARVFDANTGCTDDTYNENTYGIILVGASLIDVNLKWDMRKKKGEDVELCSMFDGNILLYTLSISGHRSPSKLNGSATDEELRHCKWKYKYKYIISSSKSLPPASSDEWKDGIGTTGVAGEDVIIDFNVPEYNANGKINTSSIAIEAKVKPGDGQVFVWVKIYDIIDGFGSTYDGDISKLFTNAIINKVPARQEIISD